MTKGGIGPEKSQKNRGGSQTVAQATQKGWGGARFSACS